jgi:alkylation response protein AidB-like acyl-CoA dehydrogenase
MSVRLFLPMGRVAVRLCLDAIQLFGGYGYLREFPVEGLLRDAISLRAMAAVVPPPRARPRLP